MSLITITQENVKEVKEREVTAVEFWAPWCGYCKRLAPVLKQLGKTYEEIDILQINIDDFPDLAKEYGIETIPTLAILRKGSRGKLLIAPSAKSQIVDFLREEKLIA